MIEGRTATILTVAALACHSLSACKGCHTRTPQVAAERISLAGVTVRPIPPIDFRGARISLDVSELAAKSRKVLEDAAIFAPPDAKRPTAQVSLEAEVFSALRSGTPVLGAKVHLRITVRPSATPVRFTEDAEAIGQAPLATGEVDDARGAFQRLTERTAADLLRTYVARQRLWDGGSREIAAALRSADRDLKIEALRVIGVRKVRAKVPAVLLLLSDDDEDVRDAALGALVALRERSAVKALALSRQMRDAREMRKILDAIATLGGREARDYLSFVAETHDDAEIRTMAKEALDRLERHEVLNKTTK